MKKLFSGLLVVGLLMSPLEFQSEDTTVSAAQKQTPSRDLLFYTTDDDESSLDFIKSTKEDDSFGEIRNHLKEAKIKVKVVSLSKIKVSTNSIPNADELAFPLEQLQKDADLRQFARNALHQGKKVYLYGQNLTPEAYMQELGLDKLSTVQYPANYEGDLKAAGLHKVPELTILPEKPVQVIGYTMDKTISNQLYYSSFDSQKMETYMYLRSIIDDQINTMKKNKKEQEELTAQRNTHSIGKFFAKKRAFAAVSTQVKSATNINNYVYGNELGKLIAIENNDWFLYKEPGDSDVQFDHVSVRDHFEVTFSNGGHSNSIVVDHDIPDDYDEIYQWSPLDQNANQAVTVTLPWGLEWQFDPSGSIAIDEMGSQTYDYARWEVKPSGSVSTLPNPFRFTPGTSWMSNGTLAKMDIRHQGKYKEYISDPNMNTPSFLFDVRYDY